MSTAQLFDETPTAPSPKELVDRFIFRWVPRVQQEAARKELDALLAVIKGE